MGAAGGDPGRYWLTFYRDGTHGSTLEDPVIGDIAAAHGKTPAQVMLRWGAAWARLDNASRNRGFESSPASSMIGFPRASADEWLIHG
jgi:hypothetical protein